MNMIFNFPEPVKAEKQHVINQSNWDQCLKIAKARGIRVSDVVNIFLEAALLEYITQTNGSAAAPIQVVEVVDEPGNEPIVTTHRESRKHPWVKGKPDVDPGEHKQYCEYKQCDTPDLMMKRNDMCERDGRFYCTPECAQAEKPTAGKTTGGVWHKKYEACQGCGTTEKKYIAKGLCTTCYFKQK